MTKIDQEITALESRLSILHTQRLGVLEQQVRETQDRIKALGGSAKAAPIEVPAARAFAPRQTPATVTAEPVRRGRRPGSKNKPKTSPKSASKGKRTRTPSDVVNQKILTTVKEGGDKGLSQMDISVRSGLNYQTTAKKLRELQEIVKNGSGKSARYFLKPQVA